MVNKILSPIRKFIHAKNFIIKQEQIAIDLLAALHVERVKKMSEKANIAEAEFKVSSQFGEDGIIQYIINKIPIENKVFVEFGVENYLESNTRFLLRNNNWRGLVIDGSEANIQYIKQDDISWRNDLKSIASFITKDNINSLIASAGIKGDIGLLSVDIDGNDYWVWDAIDVISPRIVICEYNSLFGCEKLITVPYDPSFIRTRAHYSNLYYGASLPALCHLAERKGYAFIGSNSAGNNAFFVRKDLAEPFNVLTAKKGYVTSKIRESRDRNRRLTFLSGADRLNEISECIVYDLETSENHKIKDVI